MKNKEILAAFGAVAIAALLDKLKNNIDSEQFSLIIQKLDLIMATKQQQYDSLMARYDAVSTDIAADYAKLLKEVQDGTVSQESLDRGAANVAKLETMAATVTNEPEVTDPGTGGETTDPGTGGETDATV